MNKRTQKGHKRVSIPVFDRHCQFSSRSLGAIPLQFLKAILFLKHSLPDRTSWPCQSLPRRKVPCVLSQPLGWASLQAWWETGEALTKMQVGNWYQYFLAQLLGTQGFTQLTAGLVAPYLLGAPAQPALGTQEKPRVQITPQAFCSSPPLYHAALGKWSPPFHPLLNYLHDVVCSLTFPVCVLIRTNIIWALVVSKSYQ